MDTNEQIKDLQNKCKIYQEMIINLTSSVQALYEVLVENECIDPTGDAHTFNKSHTRNVALMDQALAGLLNR